MPSFPVDHELLKDTMKKMKRQAADWERVFLTRMSEKEQTRAIPYKITETQYKRRLDPWTAACKRADFHTTWTPIWDYHDLLLEEHKQRQSQQEGQQTAKGVQKKDEALEGVIRIFSLPSAPLHG
ncbi:uncharacterized protein ACBT57_017064 [Dama dama]